MIFTSDNYFDIINVYYEVCMKNKKMNIIICVLIASVILNIILCVLLISKKQISNDEISNNGKANYFGLYQTTFYNNYSKQIILTVRLNDDGSCRYGQFAAEYASEGTTDCTYVVNGKNISLNLYSESQNPQHKEGQILDSGMLFIDGKQLSKID